jgi:hypothetical protein
MDVTAQAHDFAVLEREHGKRLPVLEPNAGEFVASVIAETENHVLVVGEQLDRVYLVQLGRCGAQPRQRLVASIAGDPSATSTQTTAGLNSWAITSIYR